VQQVKNLQGCIEINQHIISPRLFSGIPFYVFGEERVPLN